MSACFHCDEKIKDGKKSTWNIKKLPFYGNEFLTGMVKSFKLGTIFFLES